MPRESVAVVTGSGKRRVGWHVAAALAARRYRLTIHYRNSAHEATETVAYLEQQGTQAIAVQADLRHEQAVRSMVDQTLARFGRIDVLVNCASSWESKKLEETTVADLTYNYETNTLGTFLCSQQVGLAMVRQPEGGCIITLGDWAIERPYLNYAAYLISKGAIPTLTRCLAVELGLRNSRVRVNCVMPGPVMFGPELSEEERRQSIRGTLVKHEGSPDNVAQAVLSLIDNDFVTGACLTVDGGRSVYAPE